MIWCDYFVIGSIPRTGTDILTYLCTDIKGLQGVWRKNRHSKHNPLTNRWRQGMVGGLTFRRFRGWFLSFVALAVNDGLWPLYSECKMPWPSSDELFDPDFGPRYLGELPGPLAGLGDRYLEYMTDGGRIPLGEMLRSEYIAEDLITLLRAYGFEYDEDVIRAKGAEYHPNKAPLNYVKDPLHYWSEDTLVRLEAANPQWMDLERSLY